MLTILFNRNAAFFLGYVAIFLAPWSVGLDFATFEVWQNSILEIFKLGTAPEDETRKIFLAQLWEAVCLDQSKPKRLAYVETLYLSHMF